MGGYAMSDTPRTDAAVITGFLNVGRYQEVAPIDHARQLERELARAEERVTELLRDREIIHQDCERWIALAKSERAQRDALAMSYGELIAAVRVNAMRDTFREATVEQVEEWLKPWVDKLAVKGETK